MSYNDEGYGGGYGGYGQGQGYYGQGGYGQGGEAQSYYGQGGYGQGGEAQNYYGQGGEAQGYYGETQSREISTGIEESKHNAVKEFFMDSDGSLNKSRIAALSALLLGGGFAVKKAYDHYNEDEEEVKQPTAPR
ncbi:hypothetical protein LPJ68_003241, partial [Coemansia sp. RSA 1086]